MSQSRYLIGIIDAKSGFEHHLSMLLSVQGLITAIHGRDIVLHPE